MWSFLPWGYLGCIFLGLLVDKGVIVTDRNAHRLVRCVCPLAAFKDVHALESRSFLSKVNWVEGRRLIDDLHVETHDRRQVPRDLAWSSAMSEHTMTGLITGGLVATDGLSLDLSSVPPAGWHMAFCAELRCELDLLESPCEARCFLRDSLRPLFTGSFWKLVFFDGEELLRVESLLQTFYC